jgi:hypothetical protein
MKTGVSLMSFGRRVWHAWKRIGQAIGDFIARIVLSVFYFTVFAPFGLAVRLFADPLDFKHKAGSAWLQRSTNNLSLEDSRKLS